MAPQQRLQVASGHAQLVEAEPHAALGPLQCLTLSRREVCVVLGISPSTFDRLRQAGCAPQPIPGLPNRYARSTVEAFVVHATKVGRLSR